LTSDYTEACARREFTCPVKQSKHAPPRSRLKHPDHQQEYIASSTGLRKSAASKMESPNSEHQAGLKRKRSPVPGACGEEGRPAAASAAGVPKIGIGNVTQINYLVRAKAERLRLIEGDGETFANVLGMIDDYEGM
jgi:hypothetical protein